MRPHISTTAPVRDSCVRTIQQQQHCGTAAFAPFNNSSDETQLCPQKSTTAVLWDSCVCTTRQQFDKAERQLHLSALDKMAPAQAQASKDVQIRCKSVLARAAGCVNALRRRRHLSPSLKSSEEAGSFRLVLCWAVVGLSQWLHCVLGCYQWTCIYACGPLLKVTVGKRHAGLGRTVAVGSSANADAMSLCT